MNFIDCLNKNDLELDKFKEHKLYCRHLYKSYDRLSKKAGVNFNFASKADKVKNCATFLDFSYTASGKSKLVRANFCKDRLCCMCNSRRSKKVYNQVYSCSDYLYHRYNCNFIMLTLTVCNVKDYDLSYTIDRMQRGFSNMLKNYKSFKKICFGCVKVLEITYNRKSDTYHPHYHVLIAVRDNYFKSDDYLKRDDFLNMWRKAYGDNSITQVDVRKVYCNNKRFSKSCIASACAEVAKYAVKPNSYIFTDDNILTDKVVYTLSTVLFKRRFISFTGVFKTAYKLLFAGDSVEDGDLLCSNVDDSIELSLLILRYRWSFKHNKYVLHTIINNINESTGEILLE